jgi:hypothetical protein
MDNLISTRGIPKKKPDVAEPKFVTQDQIAGLIQFLDIAFDELDQVSGGLRGPDGGTEPPDGGSGPHPGCELHTFFRF